MASVAAALPSLYSSSSSSSRNSRLEISLPSSSSSSSFSFLPRTRTRTRRNNVAAAAAAKYHHHHLTVKRKNYFHGIITRVNAAIEEETTGTTATLVVPEETAEASELIDPIPVSLSDILLMDLRAEGTIKESDVPKMISALEQIEGVSGVDVHVDGSIATVVLRKQTVFLAKAVASELIEVIQGSGFKLQTLNLSYWDEEEDANY